MEGAEVTLVKSLRLILDTLAKCGTGSDEKRRREKGQKKEIPKE